MTNQSTERPALLTEHEVLKAVWSKMSKDMHAIRQFLQSDALDIDEWKYEQSATTFQPTKNYDGPVVIETILAVFPPTSTSVIINLGAPGRIIPVTVLTPGVFFADSLRLQMAQDDWPRNMVIAPAGTGYINFCGYADKKIVDHA